MRFCDLHYKENLFRKRRWMDPVLHLRVYSIIWSFLSKFTPDGRDIQTNLLDIISDLILKYPLNSNRIYCCGNLTDNYKETWGILKDNGRNYYTEWGENFVDGRTCLKFKCVDRVEYHDKKKSHIIKRCIGYGI